MHKLISILGIMFMLYSCGSNEGVNNCRYNRDKLLTEIDTALLDKRDYPDEQFYEVLDKGSNIGARGIYKFDKDETLRFYAFLLSDSNDYIFSREYDSLGTLIDSTGREVVQWYFRKISSDSVKITFYLYGINQTYDDINLGFGTATRTNIDLFKSPIFSNILGGSFTSVIDKEENRKIFITGKRFNTCSGEKYSFTDSTEVPSELFDN